MGGKVLVFLSGSRTQSAPLALAGFLSRISGFAWYAGNSDDSFLAAVAKSSTRATDERQGARTPCEGSEAWNYLATVRSSSAIRSRCHPACIF